MAQKFVNKAVGLHTFKNELTVPDGAMNVADNVLIDRDGIIESRRGYNFFADFGISSDRANQLMQYKDRILLQYDTKLLYENNGVFTEFDGDYSHVNSNRMKYIESKGNLYFTTTEGVKKISAKNSSQFSPNPGYIYNAGAVRGLDFTVRCNYEVAGFFLPNSTLAYRIVWGYNDTNNNLVLGYPSESVVVQNVDLLNSCNVDLKISIPTEISDSSNAQNYFYQVYRSNQKEPYNAAADVEYKLVIEEFPDSTDLSNGFVETQDITPDTFRNNGTNLYTNEVAGETEAQANAIPPLASDICLFKNSIFYANTKTRHNKTLNLLSIDELISNDSKIYIGNDEGVQEYTFRGINQVSKIDFSGYTATNYTTELDQKYFFLNAANDIRKYYVWFDGAGSNAIQTVTFGAEPTSGTFKLGLFEEYTADINYNASASDIKSKLESLSVIDLVTVVKASPTVFTVEFKGSLSMQDIPTLTYEKTDLVEGVNPVSITVDTTQTGVNNVPTNPDIVGKQGIRIDLSDMIDVTDTSEVISRIEDTFLENQYAIDFKVTLGSDYIEFTNEEAGPSTEVYGGTILSALDIDDIIFQSGNSVLLTFNGTPNLDNVFENNEITITGASNASNNGTFTITGGYSDTFQVLIDNPARSDSTDDESGSSAVGTITRDFPTDIIFTTPTSGLGESTTDPYEFILLSTDPSAGIKLEATSRSLIRVVNSNSNSIVNGFYLSTVNDVPGQFNFQAKTVEDKPFYIATNNTNFARDITPSLPIVESDLTASLSSDIITITWNNHGLNTGDNVFLFNPIGLTVGEINGVYTVTFVDINSFTVNIPNLIGTLTLINAFKPTIESDNEEKPNRVYYSKTDIPEAVPFLNYFDVGSQDSTIHRIIPLRDSLFILKDEGIYRLSDTDSTNFVVTLFDESSPIIAPDSPAVLNNQIFMLSTQGVITVSDTGVDIISRNIEKDILFPTSNNFPNFSTQCFGIASESDRSYYLFLPEEITDVYATQCFRFNVFTRAWTRLLLSKTCGIVKKADDKIYFGAADTNYIEKERKNFLRTDYADRQYDNEIFAVSNGNQIELGAFQNINQYDVIYQEQYITINRFNKLLSRLDDDITLKETKIGVDTYVKQFSLDVGGDVGSTLATLITQISLDDTSQTYTSFSSTIDIELIRDAFNQFMVELNESDGTFYSNYREYTDLITYEAVISSLDKLNLTMSVLVEAPFVVGPCVIFEAIPCNIEYAPETLGDASLGKQFREATLMFDQLSFTFGVMGFRSDVYASELNVTFEGEGNGDYGTQVYGERIYGGESNERPFRTYVPRNHQRCRMIYILFSHTVARENFLLNGYSVTYNESTTPRFYRR